MNLFQVENKDYFLEQVSLFKPPRTQKDKDRVISKENLAGTDTIIATRIRPLLEHETTKGHVVGVVARGVDNCADVHELRKKVNGRPALTTTSFQFDCTYGPDSSSDDIYQHLVEPLIPWACVGGISTLFAYGQTGSGKTYTVNALAKRAARHLFNGGLTKGKEVFMSCFELAGNVASDLLNDRYTIKVMEDNFGETQLVGAREPQITSSEQFLDYIEQSMTFRRSAPTLKNELSSRTHAVYRIKIVNKEVTNAPDGLLFLIDLAGSEAASDVKEHSQERMKEAREINTSLSVLKDCIRGRSLWYVQEQQAASKGIRVKQSHIPFRSSTLTRVLKHVFDINSSRHCKTSVIACVGPSLVDIGPAKNTFRYAELLSVPIPAFKQPAHNEQKPTTWTNEFLQQWITNNSGSPAIDGTVVAPVENGIQICRLPAGEFILRCLKTANVDENQARAFHSKLIALHIDSRKLVTGSTSPTSGEAESVETSEAALELTKPFQERLRAGMFVQLKKAHTSQEFIPVCMILSPETGFDGMYGDGIRLPGRNTLGDQVEFGKGIDRYICCEVAPSPMPGAYEIDVRRQALVAAKEMDKELLMEYDRGTRYYYMTV